MVALETRAKILRTVMYSALQQQYENARAFRFDLCVLYEPKLDLRFQVYAHGVCVCVSSTRARNSVWKTKRCSVNILVNSEATVMYKTISYTTQSLYLSPGALDFVVRTLDNDRLQLPWLVVLEKELLLLKSGQFGVRLRQSGRSCVTRG